MATGKKSFVLYCDLISTIEKLPDDKAGMLFKIILQYVNDQNPTVDDLLLQVAFEPVKQQLKRDLREWETIREKRVMAGKASADKRKQESTHVDTCQHMPTVNVTDTVNVTVTDTVKEKKKRSIFIKPTIEEIKEYCNKEKLSVDVEYFYNYYEGNGWMIGKVKMSNWKATIKNWHKRNSGQTATNEVDILKRCQAKQGLSHVTIEMIKENPEKWKQLSL